jgi:two-component system, chemotaxis family, chemotaxis protein CheY
MGRILIVDDSRSLRVSMRFMLEELGHEVIEAENGKVGLAKNAKMKFDMIITDVNMPELDGIVMTESIRSSSCNRFVPILIVTTEGGASKIDEGKKAGASGWIVKPFTPEQLAGTVTKFIP